MKQRKLVSDLVLQAFELPQSLRGVIQRKWRRFTVENVAGAQKRLGKPLSRTAGGFYHGFGGIQCCLGLAGDLTFCDQVEKLGFQGCRRVVVANCHSG